MFLQNSVCLTEMLSVTSWKELGSFTRLKAKQTQIGYYESKNAAPEILQLVALESKAFGSAAEEILKEVFGLGKRTNTQHDATWQGKKIEIKAARYWAGTENCRWQHLEPDHDYEYVLFALLGFQEWNCWILPKTTIMGELREKHVVTFQGKQGWWVTKSALEPWLKCIKTKEELYEILR